MSQLPDDVRERLDRFDNSFDWKQGFSAGWLDRDKEITPKRRSDTAIPRDDILAALDLLDQLVDPLLDVSVCKGRVVAWKQMVRKLVEENRS